MKFIPLCFLLLLASLAAAQTPAAPPLAEMQKWVATLDATWQETFAKEVTAPFDAEMAKLAQQYLAAIDSNSQKASTAGNLDQTVLWRAERDRFALAKDVPTEDEATAPLALKQLRASWRAQAARLQGDRATHARAVLARYDAVLADAQKRLTQAQRIEEALLLKKQREDVAARWTPASAAPPAVTPEAAPPATPAPKVATVAPGKGTPSGKAAKMPLRETVERLLAAGADVTIGEYRSQVKVRTAADAPEKFAFFSIAFNPRKNGPPVTDDDLATIEPVTGLRWLSINDLDISDAGLLHVRALRDLQHLTLQNLNKLTPAGLSVIAELPALESVRLYSMRDPVPVAQAIAANKRIEEFETRTMEVPEAVLAALAASPSLFHLNFEKGTTGLTPAGIARAAKIRKLRNIAITDCPVDDAMAAELGKIAGLDHLHIGQNTLTEAGIASLGNLRNLTWLHIPSPPVTPASLAALKKLRSLKTLQVDRQIPAEDVDKLRAALKGVELTGYK